MSIVFEIQTKIKNLINAVTDTWIDPDTNLEWRMEKAEPMSWNKAVNYAKSLGDGWRLPVVKELFTLLDYAEYNPAVRKDVPFRDSSYYWSSDPCANSRDRADYSDIAWYVYFYNGHVNLNYKSNDYYVHCVRNSNKEN